MKTVHGLSSKSKVIQLLLSSHLSICLLFCLQACGGNRPSAFFVAPDGRDTNPGAVSAPFASPEAARNAIRKLKQTASLPTGGITVYLRAGSYPRAQTFELNQQDSGTAESPIVYRNYQSEKVSFTGGVSLKASYFQRVQDPLVLQKLPEESRHQVLMANLKNLGIVDYGTLYQHGFSLPIQEAPLELFVDGQPMTLARWPNERTVKIGTIIDRGSNPREGDRSNRGGSFRFDFDRASRWTQAGDIWLNGIFSYGYADDNLKVAQIDLKKKEMKLVQPHIYSLMGPDEKTGGQHLRSYYAYNLLEEIDRPGEYFVDRDKGILYFWPTSEMPGREIVVSVFEKPLVAMENVSHTAIEGLTFENARGMAVYLEEGEGNRLRNCTFRNLGTVAVCMGKGVEGPQGPIHEFAGSPAARKIGNVSAQGYQNNAWNRLAGKNHVIENCLIYNTGAGGIILDGGDRKTLVPGNNEVLGCHFHHFNRWNKTYCPAVALKGVRNRVVNNYIHDAPHQPYHSTATII